MKDYIVREFRQLLQNLWAGVLVCAFRRRSFERFQYSVDQVYWLLLFGLLLNVATGWVVFLPRPEFSIYGLYIRAVALLLDFVATFLIAKLLGDSRIQLRLLVVFFSSGPVIIFTFRLVEILHHYDASFTRPLLTAAYAVVVLWFLAQISFVFYHLGGRARGRAFLALCTFVLVVNIPLLYLPHWKFWIPHRTNDSSRYAQLYSENALYLQDRLVRAATRRLLAGASRRPDVYFVGFAGYGSQDVFMKEVKYAKHLFEDRFETRGRDVVLINNTKTFDTVPLATETNLRRVLLAVGRKMKPDDFLFLYMTSHGSSRPRLAVNMWPYDLDWISPKDLRVMLDRAGIRNRVLMISACYSGGFVTPLENANTVVITAAAADRTSFGCSNENNFTYFGQALLADELQQQSSVLAAFRAARKDIYAREQREHLEHSNPQLFVGRNMSAKLRALERTLAAERAVHRILARAPSSAGAALSFR